MPPMDIDMRAKQTEKWPWTHSFSQTSFHSEYFHSQIKDPGSTAISGSHHFQNRISQTLNPLAHKFANVTEKAQTHKRQRDNEAPTNYTFSEGGRVGKKKEGDELGRQDGDQITWRLLLPRSWSKHSRRRESLLLDTIWHLFSHVLVRTSLHV